MGRRTLSTVGARHGTCHSSPGWMIRFGVVGYVRLGVESGAVIEGMTAPIIMPPPGCPFSGPMRDGCADRFWGGRGLGWVGEAGHGVWVSDSPLRRIRRQPFGHVCCSTSTRASLVQSLPDAAGPRGW
jgi:hypothetical protein